MTRTRYAEERSFMNSLDNIMIESLGREYILSFFRQVAENQQKTGKGLPVRKYKYGYTDSAVGTLNEDGSACIVNPELREYGLISALADRVTNAYRVELTDKGEQFARRLFPDLYSENKIVVEVAA